MGTAESYNFAENTSIEADNNQILNYGLNSLYLTLSDIGANLHLIHQDRIFYEKALYVCIGFIYTFG